MTTVLRIRSSILGEQSVSSALTSELLEALGRKQKFTLVDRDFASQPIPHLDGAWLTALSTQEADRTDEQRKQAAFSNELVAELNNADTVVIALPMYNFSLPSMLKAWIDHIARAGVTFKYTDSGAVGLLRSKKVYLVAAMGGIHEVGESDFLRPYMQHVFSFLGLTDVELITANGLNMGDQKREQGLQAAREQLSKLAKNVNETEMLEEEVA